MKNITGINKLGAILYLFPAEGFTCPVLPSAPVEADYVAVKTAIETFVSTSTTFGGKRVEGMIQDVSYEEEYADAKSIKTACGEEFCRTVKPTGKVTATVWNIKDPNMMAVLTGRKFFKGAGENYFSYSKLVCQSQPNVIVKIVTCTDDGGLVDELYIAPTALAGTIVSQFKDYCENDFEGAEISFEALSGACLFQVVNTFDSTQNLNPLTV